MIMGEKRVGWSTCVGRERNRGLGMPGRVVWMSEIKKKM